MTQLKAYKISVVMDGKELFNHSIEAANYKMLEMSGRYGHGTMFIGNAPALILVTIIEEYEELPDKQSPLFDDVMEKMKPC